VLHRTVRSDNSIFMGKKFADPTAQVELRRPGQPSVIVAASALDKAFVAQQRAYQAEAHTDADGTIWGPTGRRRWSNTIRIVSLDGVAGVNGLDGVAGQTEQS
jgi:hypothetical protein